MSINQLTSGTGEIGENSRIDSIQSDLSSIGISIDTAILERILKVSEKSFLQDIESLKISSAQPKDTTFFETIYIKGFGQMVTFGGKEMSVAEVAKVLEGMGEKERDDAINGMIEKTFDMYDNYKKGLEQAAIKEGEKIDAGTQGAINKGKILDNQTKLNNQLADVAQSLKSLGNGTGAEISTKAREYALKNPPKELQDFDEDTRRSLIKSKRFDNLILADYAINNAQDIQKGLSVEDSNKFIKTINEAGRILNRYPPKDWPDIVETKGGLVLGESRDRIRQTGDKIISEGYNKQVVWDPSTRTLYFRGESGMKAIDTASMPPKERVIEGNLSIGRELDPIDPDKKQLQIERASLSSLRGELENQGVNLGNIMTIKTDSALAQFGNIANKFPKRSDTREKFNAYLESKAALRETTKEDGEKKISALERVKEANRELLKAQKELASDDILSLLNQTNHLKEEERTSLKNIEGELEAEKTQIDTYIGSLKRFTTKEGEVRTLEEKIKSKEPNGNFDQDARSSLKYLTYIGYNFLGQDALDKIIGAINQRNKGSLSDIDVTKNPKLDTNQQKELLRVLARITRLHPSMQDWKNADPTDEFIAMRQMNSPNWKTSLIDIRKSESFQDAINGPIDTLTRYIYDTKEISKENRRPNSAYA